MTAASPLDPALPISFKLATEYAARRQYVAAHPQGSFIDNLGANIDSVYAMVEETIQAIQALEAEVRDLKAAR
jgi:hypothetical protein